MTSAAKLRTTLAAVTVGLLLTACGDPAPSGDSTGERDNTTEGVDVTAREAADQISGIVNAAFETVADLEGFTGTAADLDALRQSCTDGDMAACDDLYWESESGSDDETFGSTCGNTTDGSTAGACAQEPFDAAAARAACADGDMAACDDLYWASESGSDDETFAATCGNTTDGGTGGSCDRAQTDTTALRQACTDGDMAACDDLYWESESGSDDEMFGATCGNTQSAIGGSCEAVVDGVYSEEVQLQIDAITTLAQALRDARAEIEDLNLNGVELKFLDPDFPLWVEITDSADTFCITPSDEDDVMTDVTEGACDEPTREDKQGLDIFRLALDGNLDAETLYETALTGILDETIRVAARNIVATLAVDPNLDNSALLTAVEEAFTEAGVGSADVRLWADERLVEIDGGDAGIYCLELSQGADGVTAGACTATGDPTGQFSI